MNRGTATFAKRIVRTLILAVALLCVVTMSVGCASHQDGSQSDQKIETDGYSTDVDQAASADNGCYVRTSAKRYNADGEILLEDTFDHDNRGCTVNTLNTKYKSDDTVTQKRESLYDENGYELSCKVSTDDGVLEYSYERELNSEGQQTKCEIFNHTNGVTLHNEYEYHDNGVPKELRQESSDKLISLNRYDENGFQVECSTSTWRSTFDWQFDDYGWPVSVEIETKYKDEDSYKHVSYTFECDENGNIVRQFDENGSLVAEYSYETVDNPSPAVRTGSKTVGIYY